MTRPDSALVPFILVLALTVTSPVHGEPKDNKDGKGHWTDWSEMSECSATCGSGTIRISRTYVPGPNDPVRKEPYMSYSTYTCTNRDFPECPTDGRWSGWGRWNECSKACGSGVRKRRRSCIGPTHGGEECEGENFDEEKCNRDPCPRLPPHFDMSKCLPATNFTCSSGKMCILTAEKCDGKVQCHDGSDEMNCPRKYSTGRVRYDLRNGSPALSKPGLCLNLVTSVVIGLLLTTTHRHL